MVKIKIKTVEAVQLHNELMNLLVEENVNFSVKYEVSKLLDKTKLIAERYEKVRVDIITKYGVKIEGKEEMYTLENSENAKKGYDELDVISKKTEEFPKSFQIEDFKDLKSKYPYYIIFKLF